MLKPQDVLFLLKLDAHRGAAWSYARLSKDLGLSQGEIANCVRRTTKAGLLDPSTHEPLRTPLYEFLVHGLKYVFPAERGPRVRGMPTAASAPPLSERLVAPEAPLVWPHASGTVRGESLHPLYRTAPSVATADPAVYRRLALVDALRAGTARERRLAADLLQEEMAA